MDASGQPDEDVRTRQAGANSGFRRRKRRLGCGSDESAFPALAGRGRAARAERPLARVRARTGSLANRFESSAGGPQLLVVALVSLGLAVLVSTLVVWLAALGVDERRRLRPGRVAPELRLRRLAFRAVALYVLSSLAFALFESYLHWRAGIGFHGISCLVGPVHRNVIPLLAALSLTAAALAEAAEHLLGWMRAVVRELRRRGSPPSRSAPHTPGTALPPHSAARSARGLARRRFGPKRV